MVRLTLPGRATTVAESDFARIAKAGAPTDDNRRGVTKMGNRILRVGVDATPLRGNDDPADGGHW